MKIRHPALLAIVFFLLSAVTCAGVWAQGNPDSTPALSSPTQTVQPGPPEASNQARAANEPTLETQCVRIRDSNLWTSITDNGPAGSVQGNTGIAASQSDCGPDNSIGENLVGTGDLLIALNKTGFLKTQQSLDKSPGQFVLFLNGVALPKDAELLAAEHEGDFTFLRYRLHQGPELQKLWSMLYADGALYKPQRLHIALGWKPENGQATMIPTRSMRPGATATVSITMTDRLWWGMALVLVSVMVLVFLGMSSDTLRDAPDKDRPAWWGEAWDLRHTLKGLNGAELEKKIQTIDANYVEKNHARYERLAQEALSGEEINKDDELVVKVGLALQSKPWALPRATFSLSRTQMALWFTFAVATGVFLWILYGDLRRIDGSLLALLGISVGTSGVSWAADRNANGRAFMPSKGFWSDLITGFDERKQLHRYQAVVVNLLLLVVGGYHVIEQLTYPVFEPTWLVFLVISGGAYGMGKQVLEKP